MLLMPSRPSCPPLMEGTVCPKSTVKVGAQLCSRVGVKCVFGSGRWGVWTKSRPDPALASTDPSRGCVPKEPMGQPGVKAGETAGAVPARLPGHTASWLFQTVGLFDFWVLLQPHLQPGLRDALQGGAVTLSYLRNRHHRAPSSGSAVPTPLFLLPPPPMRR